MFGKKFEHEKNNRIVEKLALALNCPSQHFSKSDGKALIRDKKGSEIQNFARNVRFW
jgi:hypothetical protein